MRKTIVLLAACLCCIISRAQDNPTSKYSISASIGTGLSMSEPAATPFTVQAMGSYNFDSRWSAGVGTGYSLYNKMSLIPLYVHGKCILKPNAKFKPLVSCDIGYSLATGSSQNGGLYLNPSLGVQHELWNKQFTLCIGYQIQDMERNKSHSDEYFNVEFEEKLSFHSISIKLGITL